MPSRVIDERATRVVAERAQRVTCPGLDGPQAHGWPAPARAILERAARRHGGWERWHALGTVELRLDHLGGRLPVGKGLGRTFPAPTTVEVTPREGRVRFAGYPRPGVSGLYHAGDVSLVEDTTGALLTASAGHRRTFDGLAGYRSWTPLDGLYFFGYALCNYFGLPFLLGGCRLVGTLRDGLTVEFPAGYDTHGHRQSFFFDPDGLLVRHDYVAEIVGFWARGCHYSSEYVEADGLPFATRRHVVARMAGRPTPFTVLEARLGGFRVRR
jgi:hypothetical protein